VRTIAFPSISTGVYGYPKDEAAKIAVSVMREYEGKFDEIVACCFSVADKALYDSLLAAH
jgi:O-acetyl-ADP-ribose deacetylase (regulator of RNase III)